MSSWLRRIVSPLIKPKIIPKASQGKAAGELPSGTNSVSTGTQSETKESQDVVEKYEKRLLAELEKMAKNCRRQNYLDNLQLLNAGISTQNRREENFERLWSRARSRVDRRLAKVKKKHSSTRNSLPTDNSPPSIRHVDTLLLNKNLSDGETLATSDLDTLNDYSWEGIECAADTNSRPISRARKKAKRNNKAVSNLKPRRLGE
ncbi:unnamed protein product [Hydatigera taeniaeformis]|uniref:Uncharacterized protein n=1 Tax=Hydatigena taeniaeformis TaxID=6205 RepID=A0A0R3WHR7_HYDTA|nr:unnamed protein product [Hydatigera taeniaeformis]